MHTAVQSREGDKGRPASGNTGAVTKVAVAGATGYTGQELLRLLARHPSVAITLATSSGATAARRLPALTGIWNGTITPLDPATLAREADVVFLALPDKAAAERRLHGVLETYYSAPAAAMMARQATYAGPIEGCAEWLGRWIDAGARHLALRFAGGDQLAQVSEVAAKLLPRLK